MKLTLQTDDVKTQVPMMPLPCSPTNTETTRKHELVHDIVLKYEYIILTSSMLSLGFFQNYLDKKIILMLSLFASFHVLIARVITKLQKQ